MIESINPIQTYQIQGNLDDIYGVPCEGTQIFFLAKQNQPHTHLCKKYVPSPRPAHIGSSPQIRWDLRPAGLGLNWRRLPGLEGEPVFREEPGEVLQAYGFGVLLTASDVCAPVTLLGTRPFKSFQLAITFVRIHETYMSKYKVTVYQVQAHKRRPTLQLDHLQIGVGKANQG